MAIARTSQLVREVLSSPGVVCVACVPGHFILPFGMEVRHLSKQAKRLAAADVHVPMRLNCLSRIWTC